MTLTIGPCHRRISGDHSSIYIFQVTFLLDSYWHPLKLTDWYQIPGRTWNCSPKKKKKTVRNIQVLECQLNLLKSTLTILSSPLLLKIWRSYTDNLLDQNVFIKVCLGNFCQNLEKVPSKLNDYFWHNLKNWERSPERLNQALTVSQRHLWMTPKADVWALKVNKHTHTFIQMCIYAILPLVCPSSFAHIWEHTGDMILKGNKHQWWSTVVWILRYSGSDHVILILVLGRI